MNLTLPKPMSSETQGSAGFARLIMFCALCATLPQSKASTFEPDRDWFFAHCRLHNFQKTSETTAKRSSATPLSANAIKSINGIFDVWILHGDDDPRKLAFILATARRESEGTWQPIREAPACGTNEICREAAIGKLLASRAQAEDRPVPPNYAKPAANGQRYYGRGYIQITFPENYKRADRLLGTGTKLYDHPDAVMEESTAQTILVRGMMEGWFGAKKPLSFWINRDHVDWLQARNNVNPGSPNKSVTAASAMEINLCLKPLD